MKFFKFTAKVDFGTTATFHIEDYEMQHILQYFGKVSFVCVHEIGDSSTYTFRKWKDLLNDIPLPHCCSDLVTPSPVAALQKLIVFTFRFTKYTTVTGHAWSKRRLKSKSIRGSRILCRNDSDLYSAKEFHFQNIPNLQNNIKNKN